MSQVILYGRFSADPLWPDLGDPQGPTASVDQIFRADVFFIGNLSIRMEYAAIVFEELFSDFLSAGHFEVEDHAHARRAVLPEEAAMVLALLVRRLHVYVGFTHPTDEDLSVGTPVIGLDVTAGEQVASSRR